MSHHFTRWVCSVLQNIKNKLSRFNNALRVLRSSWKCQESIPYKILHRSWCPKIFLTQIFSMKKIILKIEIFDFWNFEIFIKAKKYFHWKMKISEIFIFQWKSFFRLYEKFEISKIENFNFQNYFFHRKNLS